MIDAYDFLERIQKENVGLATGVPGSLLSPLINHIVDTDNLGYINAVSEGEAIGIAAGSSLSGRIGIVLIQNSGLGNIVNPVTSLTNVYKIPFLLIVSHRGDPENKPDAAQHAIMGKITNSLIDLIGISRQDFPSNYSEIDTAVSNAFDFMRKESLPAAFVLRRGVLQSYEYNAQPNDCSYKSGVLVRNDESPTISLSIRDSIKLLSLDQDICVSTTGIISRVLFQECDRPQNFYMQGSMGTAAALGLGVALNKPNRKVAIFDGDGSVLMRLGSLATVGYHKPANYVHVVLDNEMYASTGGQPSAAPAVCLSDLAISAGYRRAITVYGADTLSYYWNQFRHDEGPSLLHVKVKRVAEKMPPRPTLNPQEIANRFTESINE
jgi:phosphonopyruvate decarboxylase